MAEGVSRIAEARRRAAGAKQTALAAAVAGFLAIGLLAEQSHPGRASSTSQAPNVVVQSEEDDGGFSLTPGTIAPGGGSGGGAQTTVS